MTEHELKRRIEEFSRDWSLAAGDQYEPMTDEQWDDDANLEARMLAFCKQLLADARASESA